MARTVNQEEHTAKRNEILDAAQRLIYSKGYERMTIQDILREVEMSSGAFYHYFDSKPAVLEAVIGRMQEAAEQPLLALFNDPDRSAIDKLRSYFATLEQSRATQKSFLANLAQVWFSDENAIVREKVYDAMAERRAALLTEVIRQGMQEDVFTLPYVDQSGGVILALARGMGDAIAKLMLSFERAEDQQQVIEDIRMTYTVYADALERVLGVHAPFLDRPDASEIRSWFSL